MNTTEKLAKTALALAQIHTSRPHPSKVVSDSALLCLSDAQACFDRGNLRGAVRRAGDSLQYSIGVFHRDWQVFDRVRAEFNKHIKELK